MIVNDIIEIAEKMGWEIASLPTPHGGTASQEFLGNLLRALVQHKPDFILTLNHTGFDANGRLAELLNGFQIPVASWFVDHPRPILEGSPNNAQQNTQLFCFERTSMQWLSQVGFEDAHFLPTAASPNMLRNNKVLERFQHDVAFVGGSWWERARNSYSSDNQAIARKLYEEHQENLIGMLTDDQDEILSQPAEAIQIALAELSLQRRVGLIQAVESLNPAVYGDENWLNLIEGIDLHPPIDAATELPALFASTKINLNITAAQMPTAVNQRIWEVPLAGGFLLTDAQEDGLRFFEEDKSIVVYQSFEEALDKAKYYLDNDSERKKIVAKARALVEQNHLLEHRLSEIDSVMKKRFA